jgi:hypothetical protein
VIRIGLPISAAVIGTVDGTGRLQWSGLVPPNLPVGTDFHCQGFVRRSPRGHVMPRVLGGPPQPILLSGAWLGSEPLALTVGLPAVTFSDGTALLDSDTALYAGSDVDWADIDRDGFQDVLVANAGTSELPHVLLNQGGSLVNEAVSRLPVAAQAPATCAEAADVNGDGHVDIFLGTSNNAAAPAPNLLLLNDGSGHFALSTGFPAGNGQALDAEFGDVDGDRDLDLVVANQPDPLHPSEIPDAVVIYVNRGGLQGGTHGDFLADPLFGSLPGNDTHADGGDVSLGDADNDGDLDLFVARTQGSTGAQNQLYVNDGLGSFSEVTSTALPGILDNSFEAGFADFDGNGFLDLFVANSIAQVPGAHLLLNQGPIGPGGTPVFADAAANVPASFGSTTRVRLSLDVGDVDQDGDPDVAIGIHELPAGPPPTTAGLSVLLLNQGGNQGGTLGTFAVDGSFQPFGPFICSDVAFGDLDTDGDLDLYLASAGRLFVTDFQDRLLLNDY